MQDSSLYRVFNDTDFTNGGRFYGGWWQVIPSEYRTRIRINEKRTVELDFGTLHPTMLYSEVGLKPPEDSYQIGLFPRSSSGMNSLEAYRQLVKRCFNAMLNAIWRAKMIVSKMIEVKRPFIIASDIIHRTGQSMPMV